MKVPQDIGESEPYDKVRVPPGQLENKPMCGSWETNSRGATFACVQDQHGGLEMWVLLVDIILEGYFGKLESIEGLVLSSEKDISCTYKKTSS